MFDSIVQAIADYPYLGIALVFLLCGIGFPLPEELVLIAGGYVCAKFPDKAQVSWMMLWCAGSILAFDLLPFVLGRTLGARVLRLRWLRLVVTRRRLADFDRWFRRRGDLVIFFARFLAGIRVIAFFTAGVMKMRWRRFLLLDGLGIVIIVPIMVFVGHRGAGVIDDVIEKVQTIERGILLTVLAGLLVLTVWWLVRRRRRLAAPRPPETFVEPRLPVQEEGPPLEARGAAPIAGIGAVGTGGGLGAGTGAGPVAATGAAQPEASDAAAAAAASAAPSERPDAQPDSLPATPPAEPPAAAPPPPAERDR